MDITETQPAPTDVQHESVSIYLALVDAIEAAIRRIDHKTADILRADIDTIIARA